MMRDLVCALVGEGGSQQGADKSGVLERDPRLAVCFLVELSD